MNDKITDDELLNSINEVNPEIEEIPDDGKDIEQKEEVSEAAKYLGTKIHTPNENPFVDKDADKDLIEKKHLTKVGENLFNNVEIREGWIGVSKELLGERELFYPDSWEFKIRPATVEAIRNWSTIDEDNLIAMDDVFNEVIKSCISISTPNGQLPWGNLCSWDRFFFLLLIREFSMQQGEKAIKYEDECPECENSITFELTSQSMMYEFPDKDILRYYDKETRTWTIDPYEYDLDEEPIKLYVPTLEKEANIKAWLIARVQENKNRKIDNVFLKFAPWLSPKISKDPDLAKRQMKEIEMIYKSWNIEMFDFMDEVINNITVIPSQKLVRKCPICGEEVTSQIRFPGSIRDIFNVSNRRKKFGKK